MFGLGLIDLITIIAIIILLVWVLLNDFSKSNPIHEMPFNEPAKQYAYARL